MKGKLEGASKLHLVNKEILEGINKVVSRRGLSALAKLNLANDARITVTRARDLTTAALFIEKDGRIFFGLGSSKKSMYDADVPLRGYVLAAIRAAEDLEMELQIEGIIDNL